MAKAKRDSNRVTTLLGVSSADLTTTTLIAVDPATNAILTTNAGSSSGDGAILDGVSSSIKATVLDYTSSNPLAVRLTDTNGDYVAAGAGTQYTEDVASAADPIGSVIIARRRDSLSTETTTDGDNTAVNSTGKGEIYVKHVDTVPATQSGTWTVQPGNTANTTAWLMTPHDGTNPQVFLPDNTDSTAASATANKAGVASRNFAWGSSAAAWHRQRTMENATDSTGTGITATGMLAQFDDVTPGTVTENRFGNVRMSVRREVYNQIRDAAGNERGANVTAGNALVVDGSATTQPISGTVTANMGTVTADPFGANADAASATGSISAKLRFIASTGIPITGTVTVGSHAVTNAGTFATQATLQTQTDTVMIGGVNIKEINAVTPLMGNGVTGTGSLRVTVASDNTPFAIKTDQTTHGTTDLVAADITKIAGNAVSAGVGTTGTGTLRVVQANDAGKTIQSKSSSAASSGDNTILAAGTNKIKVFALSMTTTSTTALVCKFTSGAAGTELWRYVLQAATSTNTGANLATSLPGYLFATASATALILNLDSANTVHYSISYIDEA